MWMTEIQDVALWASGGIDLAAFLCKGIHFLWNLWEEPHPIAIKLMTLGSQITTTTTFSLSLCLHDSTLIEDITILLSWLPPPGPSYIIRVSIWSSMSLHDSPLNTSMTIFYYPDYSPTGPSYTFRLIIWTCEWQKFKMLPCELLVELI